VSNIITIDFDRDDSYITNPLPLPPFPQEPIYPDWPSAWKGLEGVLPAIITRFGIRQESALEFGCEYGYSTAALAQLFTHVTAVDTFLGDEHSDLQLGGGVTRPRDDFFAYTKRNLEPWPNIDIVQSDYKDWIAKDTEHYDMCHLDIVHTYIDTFTCGLWAAEHCEVLIAHDSESFPEVKRALADIAEQTGRTFYNFARYYGLGILVKR
jgi:hypothetical protein